jgi:O-succinylhomoserine sulfhydrylase
MNSIPRPPLDPEELRPESRLIHSGILRSQFGENSEALFLTQGFVYDEAEMAEARFSNKSPGFVYSRYVRGPARRTRRR